MTIRTILATMHPDVDPAAQLDAALQVAQRTDAVIDGLYVRPNPVVELAYMASTFAPFDTSYVALEQAGRERAVRARERWDAWRAAQPGMADRMHWSEREGLLEAVLERQGRLADLIVLRRPDPHLAETDRAFDAGVFSTGRPCLIVRDDEPKDLLAHVVVAWNGSLEGTHAVAGAMPLLRAAGRVSIFNDPPPYEEQEHGPELARSLTRHGVSAQVMPVPDAGGSAGAMLLQAAAAAGATLLVMGAYTHSRVRQQLLGGVTRHVLAHAAFPLLMAH